MKKVNENLCRRSDTEKSRDNMDEGVVTQQIRLYPDILYQRDEAETEEGGEQRPELFPELSLHFSQRFSSLFRNVKL